ncbi:MAG TPA: hypothetical protein VH475_18975 [Tepidisphaeraceae bacterium]|jgi:hypothetical protein
MPAAIVPILAERSTGDAMLWSLILIVAILLLFGVVLVYRKWMNADDTTSGPGFTLSDLRRLHKEGKMTTEEFEKAKSALIGSLKVAPATPATTPENPAPTPRQGPRTHPPGFDVLPPEE